MPSSARTRTYSFDSGDDKWYKLGIMRVPALLVIAVSLLVLQPAVSFGQRSLSYGQKQNARIATVNVGTTYLNKGYPGYQSASPYIGADVFFPRSYVGSRWFSRFSWRLSLDYFPLVLPEGVYGTTEDLIALSISQVYYFPLNAAGTSTLSAGFGLGGYFDWIRLETPATGSQSHVSFHPGAVFSAGWGYKLRDSLEIGPEVRVHCAHVARDYFSVNTSILLGVSWWFDQW